MGVDINAILSLWRKPYGKPVAILLCLFFVFLIFDFMFLSGHNVQYGSHPLGSTVEINIDSMSVQYRVSISIGNKKSKYSLKYTLIGPDGGTIISDEDSYSRNKRSFVFHPEKTGIYKLKVQTVHGGGPPSVMVSVDKNDRSIIFHRFR